MSELNEAMKHITTHGKPGGYSAEVWGNPKYNKYRVHYLKYGKDMGDDHTSHHDSEQDAHDTAKYRIKTLNKKLSMNENFKKTLIKNIRMANAKATHYKPNAIRKEATEVEKEVLEIGDMNAKEIQSQTDGKSYLSKLKDKYNKIRQKQGVQEEVSKEIKHKNVKDKDDDKEVLAPRAKGERDFVQAHEIVAYDGEPTDDQTGSKRIKHAKEPSVKKESAEKTEVGSDAEEIDTKPREKKNKGKNFFQFREQIK